MKSKARQLEQELLENEALVEKLVEKIGQLSFQLRHQQTPKRKASLEKRLAEIKAEKIELEKQSEKIVTELCQEEDEIKAADLENFDDLSDLEKPSDDFNDGYGEYKDYGIGDNYN